MRQGLAERYRVGSQKICTAVARNENGPAVGEALVDTVGRLSRRSVSQRLQPLR
jgi:hypothetical protein